MMVNLDFFGPKAQLHHIGMAVRSIEEAAPGLETVEDPLQQVRVGFVEFTGLSVELIEPTSSKSPIDENLQKGTKLLHICIEVPSLQVALEHCTQQGFRKISPVTPAVAFGMRKILWVFSVVFGLVELLEAEEE